jgi:benzoate membrane transport protein
VTVRPPGAADRGNPAADRRGDAGADLDPAPAWTAPRFDPATLVGVGLPLFLVTMASQNVPGMAVLAAHGYRPRPRAGGRRALTDRLNSAPSGGVARHR